MTRGLELDLRGRLRNFRLPTSRALVPLFEAVVNSLQAIDASSTSLGRVEIRVLRATQQDLPGVEIDSGRRRQPIRGYEIWDNGVGFTDENFESFCTSDSQHKAALGGRGVGRFTWLKSFEKVRVFSVFESANAELRQRTFEFSEAGISNTVDEPTQLPSTSTQITLDEIAEEYLKETPKTAQAIASRLVHHCLIAIRGCRIPVRVTLIDDDESVEISEQVDSLLLSALVDKVNVLAHSFQVTHLRMYSNDTGGNRMSLLANRREVRVDSLVHLSPHLKSRLAEGQGEPFWWVVLIESDILDQNVSSERDAFTFGEHADPLFPDQISMDAIRSKIEPVVLRRLEPLLKPVRERTIEQASNYVSNKAPEYRHLITLRPEDIASLPPDLTEENWIRNCTASTSISKLSFARRVRPLWPRTQLQTHLTMSSYPKRTQQGKRILQNTSFKGV